MRCHGWLRLPIVLVAIAVQISGLVEMCGAQCTGQCEAQAVCKECSIFSQVLKLFPRAQIRIGGEEAQGRACSSWGQFPAMLFCQIPRRSPEMIHLP